MAHHGVDIGDLGGGSTTRIDMALLAVALSRLPIPWATICDAPCVVRRRFKSNTTEEVSMVDLFNNWVIRSWARAEMYALRIPYVERMKRMELWTKHMSIVRFSSDGSVIDVR